MTLISPKYHTSFDQKERWGGLLENPLISSLQRNCLDYGRVQGLKKSLQAYLCKDILDVGCGLAECSIIAQNRYTGIDNSFRRLHFAKTKYPNHRFLMAQTKALPFKKNSFELAMLIDTSHHLSDAEFKETLKELERVSQRYVVISDPILTPNQSRLSSFFYGLDRGKNFRDQNEIEGILKESAGLELVEVKPFRTFQRLYLHAAFILKKRFI